MVKTTETFKELYNSVAKVTREIERCFPQVSFDNIELGITERNHSVDLTFEISESYCAIYADVSGKSLSRCIERLVRKIKSELNEIMDELEDELEEFEDGYGDDPQPLIDRINVFTAALDEMTF